MLLIILLQVLVDVYMLLGGVSEVFETNTVTGDEAIVLKERIGLIKLAVRTGTPLVPCYLFGNTKLYSMWTGGAGSDMNEYLRTISRKLGFATIMFWGRFGLPVPYRIPIIGCMGPPIEVEKQDNPSKEYLQKLMDELVCVCVICGPKFIFFIIVGGAFVFNVVCCYGSNFR